jgi:hypothetical protein
VPFGVLNSKLCCVTFDIDECFDKQAIKINVTKEVESTIYGNIREI